MIDQYWASWKPLNRQQPRSSRGSIGPRLRRSGSGSWEMRWDQYYINRHTGARQSTRVPRSKTGVYMLACLRKHCQDWELPLVLETESRLAPLRRALLELNKIRQQLRRADKFEQAFQEALADAREI